MTNHLQELPVKCYYGVGIRRRFMIQRQNYFCLDSHEQEDKLIV